MASLRRRVDAVGATALAVVHDDPPRVRQLLLPELDWPWPLAVDADRVAYAAWGLRRASWSTIWLDAGVYRQYARALLAGARYRGAGADLRQLGGDFVVDAAGTVAYARPQERDDRPPAAGLVRALEAAAGAPSPPGDAR